MRSLQFFENDDSRMSMARLLMFGAFVVTSAIMLILTLKNGMSEGYFYGYLGAFTGTYLGGKALDRKPEAKI